MAHSANCFVAAKAIQLGCAFVPIRNSVIAVANQDCIIAQVEQQRPFRQRLLNPLSIRYVPSDFRCPNDSSVSILHRRNSKGEMNPDAVFAQTNSFIVIDTLSSLESLKNCHFLVQTVGWN